METTKRDGNEFSLIPGEDQKELVIFPQKLMGRKIDGDPEDPDGDAVFMWWKRKNDLIRSVF